MFSRKGRLFTDPLQFFTRVLIKMNTVWVNLTYPFAAKGRRVRFHHTCDVQNPSAIALGNGVILDKDVWLHASEVVLNPAEPVLIVDDGCRISRRCHISAKNHIHIERNVLTAAGVLIMDHNHAYENVELPIQEQGYTQGGRIRIGEGCWIGNGAVIVCDSGELTLGHHCVIAANAVVTRSAPPCCVIAGNPARIVRHYDFAKREWVVGGPRLSHDEETAASVTASK